MAGHHLNAVLVLAGASYASNLPGCQFSSSFSCFYCTISQRDFCLCEDAMHLDCLFNLGVRIPKMDTPQCLCRSVVSGPRYSIPKRGSIGSDFQTGRLLVSSRPCPSRFSSRPRGVVRVKANLFSRVVRIFRQTHRSVDISI